MVKDKRTGHVSGFRLTDPGAAIAFLVISVNLEGAAEGHLRSRKHFSDLRLRMHQNDIDATILLI